MERDKARTRTKKSDGRPSVKRKAAENSPKKQAKKARRDPNEPKRPPSAVSLSTEEFRNQFQEKNPNNKSDAAVHKAGRAKWKKMSKAEKAHYVNKANKKRVEFQKAVAYYEKKKNAGSKEDAGINSAEEENESDRSKLEVHDADDEEGSGEDAATNNAEEENKSDSSNFEVHGEDDEEGSKEVAPPLPSMDGSPASQNREEADTEKGDDRLSVKKARKQGKKAGKDPKKPRLPFNAYFFFVEESRKQFLEENPNINSVPSPTAFGNALAAKWTIMTQAEKAPYLNQANEREADFQKAMADYEKAEVNYEKVGAGYEKARVGHEKDIADYKNAQGNYEVFEIRNIFGALVCGLVGPVDKSKKES